MINDNLARSAKSWPGDELTRGLNYHLETKYKCLK